MSQVMDQPAAEISATREQLVQRAAALVPQLRARAQETEDLRRIPQPTIDELTAAGLFRVFVPRRFGGYETDVRTSLEVSAELARGCGSTAWATQLINVCGWLVALYPERAQQEVFGDSPDTRTAGVLAPTATTRRADGGLVVTGRWGFGSGCLHSDWAVLGVPVVDAAGEMVDQGLALVPLSELTIEDTWFTAGMWGTGSNTFVAHEVFVPDSRILSVPRALGGDYPTEHKQEALYRSALVPVLALVLIGPPLGLARAALETVLEQVPKRGIAYTFYDKQAEAPVTHMQVAEAAIKIDTAHLHAYRAAADIDQAAARGEALDLKARARVRMDTGYVAKQCREAIETLLSVGGASSFAESNPLQRIWRDSETASRHAVVTPAINQELYGRVLVGLQENITPLI